jgi:putative acetyltransferase
MDTQRLFLRPFRNTDLEIFYQICRNPNVGPPAGWKPHANIAESWSILQSFIAQDHIWAIEKKDNQSLIGSIGLHLDQKRIGLSVRSLGYVLSEEAWGHGYATEAAQRIIAYGFEIMELTMISVYHYPFNTASERVIRKCGFVYEGTLRKSSMIFDGRIFDEVCYSMTKEEYGDIRARWSK